MARECQRNKMTCDNAWSKGKEAKVKAAYNIAVLYYNGDGVSKDFRQAVKWMRLAAEVGLPQAQNKMGVMHYTGKGAHKNLKKEGAFYTWKKEELQTLLQDDFEIFAEYFNINAYGYWEEGDYVLIKTKTSEEIAAQFSITEEKLQQKINYCKQFLFNKRKERKRPGLDDKGLTSWNAMIIKAYTKAYQIFQNEEYLYQVFH